MPELPIEEVVSMKVGMKMEIKKPPCRKLDHCPYGPMVEGFPLPENDTETTCPVFGHECPAFTVSEWLDPGMLSRTNDKWPGW